MKRIRVIRTFTSLSALLLLGACSGSYQARNVDLGDSLLVNPRILKAGTGDQALYRYKNPAADFSKYAQVMIEPVLISKSADLDADERANYRTLAHNGFIYLVQELEKYFIVVKNPGPNTMRVQMAIVDADTSKPVRTILSFTPIGIGLNILKYTATGKQTAVGEITGEVKITDAATGQVLGAALDRRVGGKNPKDIYDVWYNADSGIHYWAKKVAFVLCQEAGKLNCVSPD